MAMHDINHTSSPLRGEGEDNISLHTSTLPSPTGVSRFRMALMGLGLALAPSCLAPRPPIIEEARLIDEVAARLINEAPDILTSIVKEEVAKRLGGDTSTIIRQEVEAALPTRIGLNEELKEVLQNHILALSGQDLFKMISDVVQNEITVSRDIKEENLVAEIADRIIATLASQAQLSEALTNTNYDAEILRREMLEPVVRLSGDFTVGSGVLISKNKVDGDQYEYLLLTAAHVTRDIIGHEDRFTTPIPTEIFRPGGKIWEESFLVKFDPTIDLALLKLTSPYDLNVARFDSSRSECVLEVFSPVIAVGCPLGNDPIPTTGILSSTSHYVDGERYEMISAPTYVGNSGGGIFSLETGELEGIFSKVYTQGFALTIVSHMGLSVPRDVIGQFLSGSESDLVVVSNPND